MNFAVFASPGSNLQYTDEMRNIKKQTSLATLR